MHSIRSAIGGCALLLGFAAHGLTAQQLQPALPQEIDFSLEQDGPSPYPYQAVRVRATLRNASKKTIGPLQPLDWYLSVHLKPARAAKFTPVDDLFLGPPAWLVWRPNRGQAIPITLKAGEQTSVSVLLAVHWSMLPKEANKFAEARALFQKAGEYHLKFRYLAVCKEGSAGGVEHIYIEKQIALQVREPAGDDKAVYQFLTQNPQLDAMLLQPDPIPHDREILDVLSILEQYPKSSYGDYARFALARAYLTAAVSESPAFSARMNTGLSLLDKCAVGFPMRSSVLFWQRKKYEQLEHVELVSKTEALLYQACPDHNELLMEFRGWLFLKKDRELRENLSLFDYLRESQKLKSLPAEEWEAFRKRVPKKP